MRVDFTNNFFRNTALMEQNLEVVEEQLQEADLPEDVITDISETLESLDKRVNDLSNEGFKKRIQSAKKTLVNREISVILSSAKDLENSLINNDLGCIATKVNRLKNSLKAFQTRHGKCDFFKKANAFIKCANGLVTNPKGSIRRLENSYQALSEALSAKYQGKPPTESELILIEDLFESARAVYHHQQNQDDPEKSAGKILKKAHELAGRPFDGDVKGWFKEVDSFHEIPSFVYQNV